MPLSPREEILIAKVARSIREGDLYKALHFVGDDPVKQEIEEMLSDLLDRDTFQRVVAVFKLATDDSLGEETEDAEPA